MQYFDPSKSMNAFAAGAQIGGGIRQAQTNRQLAPLVAQGDYGQAAQVAGQRGDLASAELYRTQYDEMLKGMRAEEAEAAAKRADTLARTAYGLRNVPYEQRRAALQQQMPILQEMGIDPQQLMQFDPTDQAIDGVLAQVAPLAEMLKPYTLAPGAQRFQGGQMVADNPKAESLPTGMRMGADGQPEFIPGYLEAQERLRAAGRSSVNFSMGGATQQSLQQIPDGTPIPAELLGLEKPDAGKMYVRDSQSQYGFRQVPMPGSGAAESEDKAERNLEGTELTVGNLIGAYSTLAKNKAITSQGNDAWGNLAAIYSRTPIGKFQDEIGGDIGNLANAEARQTIDGLSMNALMKMISMSDVSARAMDSDAEMKAWLSAIKSDNYEAALTKLHVLDVSFGKGTALQEAYANGVIDLPTYQRVTRRLNSDPMTKQMFDKAQRYAQLGEAVGPSNLTGSEQQAIQDLSSATDEELLRMMTGGQ